MSDLEDLTRHDILPEPQEPRRVQPSRIVALWIGVLALLAGGVFGAVYLAGDDEGSPEEATQRMFDAVADEDVLGVLASLAPSERAPLRDNLPAIVDQLKRLGILSEDADLGKVNGVDLSFSDLKFSSKPLGEGVSTVHIDGGKASYRVVPRELPLGTFVTDLIGDELPAEPQTGSDPVVTDDPDSANVVTVKEDGRWYVSLNYSVAESMRADAGAPVPKFGQGLQARGESSPEEAVETLLRAAVGLDVQRAIELLPPDEGRVLRDYAPLFIDDAKQAASESGFKASVTSIELESKRDGAHATVALKRFALTFEAGGESGTVAFDGKCVDIGGADVPPGEGRICPEDAEGPSVLNSLASRLPGQGFVAVERDGQWYVSPTRTMLEGVVGVLRVLQRSDLEGLRDFFQGATAEETAPVG